MKKLILSILIILLSFNLIVRADEGMWIPMLVSRLNYEDMQKRGLKLTAEEIYSINQSCIKDAIVIFGRGCTGEIISDQGLLLTNHHCGYGQIQAQSAIEHDYLTDGFWAMSLAEELPNPGLTVQFLIRIEDVSDAVKARLTTDMTEEERTAEIGTAMALGTRRSGVLAQFLFEGFLLGLVGAGAGALVGTALASLISLIGIPMPPPPGQAREFTAEMLVTWPLVAEAVALAVITASLAAVYPAWRASRIAIVDALRSGR